MGAPAAAQLTGFPSSLAQGALADDVPSAFAPADLDASDFELVRVEGSDPTLHVWLERDSLRWVRVGKWVVVPRAVLRVEVKGARSGRVEHAGFIHPLIASEGALQAAIPIALVSTDSAALQVQVERDLTTTQVGYALRFRPRSRQRGLVRFDSSCSPYGLHVERGSIADDSFMYVGCRLVRTQRNAYMTATLELYVFWDQTGSEVVVDGVPVAPLSPGLYTLRVASAPAHVELAARGKRLVLGYRVPEVFHAGFLGAGVGPYYYRYARPDEKHELVLPLVTVYAGYSLAPSARVVYFNATAVHRRGYSDQGLYLWLEQVRFFDDRISMNLLLGANLLVYKRGSQTVARVNAPQGVEFIYRDFLGVGKNLTAGAFIYPDISGSAYYNGWLRWGSGRVFGEVNYLQWREPHSTGSTRTESLGVTLGMPLVRFL